MVTELLREHTAELHQRVEQALDFPARCVNPGTYRDLLVRLLGLYRPLERRLVEIDWKEVGLDFTERRKTDLLVGDLRTLGLTDLDISAVPECTALPELQTQAAAVGCLYVLEGATLGGQVIAGQVRQTLMITPSSGGAFHAAYGERSGEMWRTFRSAANAFCGDREDRLTDALRGAVTTFEAFERWLRS